MLIKGGTSIIREIFIFVSMNGGTWKEDDDLVVHRDTIVCVGETVREGGTVVKDSNGRRSCALLSTKYVRLSSWQASSPSLSSPVTVIRAL